MCDLKITIYEDDLVIGSGEYELLETALKGGRVFSLMGSSYSITNVESKTYSPSPQSIFRTESNRHVIEATKTRPVGV